jgi:hypothetical protein
MKSQAQITLERKGWARGKVMYAWLALSEGAANPHLTTEQLALLEEGMKAAAAIAEDWGINYKAIVEELEAGSETESRT